MVGGWIGFGQMMSTRSGHYKVEEAPTTIEGCPESWNVTIKEEEPLGWANGTALNTFKSKLLLVT